MAVLVCAGDDGRIELGDRTTIGRDPASAICVRDPSASRQHAEIRRRDDGRFLLVDLGSRHGTFVGKRRIEEVVLEDGDELLIGPARFTFEESLPASQAWTVATSLEKTALRLSVADDPRFRSAAEISSEEELRRDYDKLRAGAELSRAIGIEHSLPTLLRRILDAAIPLLAADRGAIALLDPATLEPTMQAGRGRGGEEIELPLSASLLREVVSAKAGVISADAVVDSRFSGAASICQQGIRSLMCVPMFYRGALVGAMQLDSLGETGVFRAKDLELFSMITSQAAVAIQNALLVQHVQSVDAEHRGRLERIVQGLPEGVLLLDSERRILTINRKAAALLPLLAGTRVGEKLTRLGEMTLDALLAQTSVELIVEKPLRRVFSVSQVVLAEMDGAQTLITLREVTEEREQQTRAAQQERLALIGQFAGGISHDFNNLLAVIITHAEFIESDSREEAQRADGKAIRDAARRAAELTQRLLSFGRREMIKPRVVELRQVIADTEKILRRTLGEHIQLSSELAAEKCRVRADPTQIEQVLLNLAVNARHAMPQGGKLQLRSENAEIDANTAKLEGIAAGTYVVLQVSDTGCGMPPEVQARVFEPFFTTRPKGEGTGLGLSTVYGIVRQAGGAISLQSQPGLGTSFRILLPITGAPLESTGEEVAAAAGGTETILVVEDERAVRQATRRSLEQAGYQVLEAGCKSEALAIASARLGSIDLLLTDLVMPGGSGKELSEELRAKRSDLPVLFMSGYFEDAIAGELRKNAVAFLPKPFTRDQLLARTRHALSLQKTV